MSIPVAAARLQSIIGPLLKAHSTAVSEAEGLPDGMVLVEGITVAMAIKRLQQLAQDMIDGSEDAPAVFPDQQRPPLAKIAETCADMFGVSMQEMKTPHRTGGLTYTARQAYFLISKRVHGSGRSYPQIAGAVGLKNHTSAIHGFRTGHSMYQTNREFYGAVKAIEKRLMG